MEPEAGKKRLDQILIEEGLISEEDIRDALLSQKVEGGKLGSHLLRRHCVDEASLVKALSAQMQCPGIVLSSLEIPHDIIEKVPEEVAVARKVIPFEYDAEQNTLKVACEDPSDRSLARELSFIASGAEIQLHVAPEIVLDTAIAKYYSGPDVAMPDAAKPAILLVSDEEHTSLVQSLLEAYDYNVTVTESTENVIDLFQNRRFHSVFIRSSLLGDRIDLADRVRRISPSTVVRCYENASSLLMREAPTVETDLFLRNIDLLISLLSSKARLPVNHGIRMARYTDELCRKLNLPDKDRLIITNAAYLHDLAMSYYGPNDLEDHRQAIKLTLRLLTSLDYSPVVLDILRSMYADLPEDHDSRLPLEVLGGNILTAVDIVCGSVAIDEHLSMDGFDAIQKRLRDLVGTTILPAVSEELIALLQGKMLDSHSAQRSVQVMVFAEEPSTRRRLELRLRNEGFGTVSNSAIASFIELYQRSRPDIIVLAVPGDLLRVTAVLDELTGSGVGLERTPTLLLTDELSTSTIINFLDRGVEDIILLDQNFDLLVCKLLTLAAKIRGGRTIDTAPSGLDAGTQGRLADINLLDLIQVLGPNGKTAKITVQPDQSPADELILYLDRGRIVFAKTEARTGADAVYQALAWANGSWKVEPAGAEDIPPANNSLSNQAILMEACRVMDEKFDIAAPV